MLGFGDKLSIYNLLTQLVFFVITQCGFTQVTTYFILNTLFVRSKLAKIKGEIGRIYSHENFDTLLYTPCLFPGRISHCRF